MRNWKKRLLTLALALCMAAALLTACGKKETPAEDFLYERNNGEITITSYTGAEREIVIPKEIDGRPVTTIGECAFEDYDLTSVTFPDTLTAINFAAFRYCTTLTEVSFSDSLTYLGYDCFLGCENLKVVELPKNTALPTGVVPGVVPLERQVESPFDSDTLIIIGKDSVAYEQLQEYRVAGSLKYKVR